MERVKSVSFLNQYEQIFLGDDELVNSEGVISPNDTRPIHTNLSFYNYSCSLELLKDRVIDLHIDYMMHDGY